MQITQGATTQTMRQNLPFDLAPDYNAGMCPHPVHVSDNSLGAYDSKGVEMSHCACPSGNPGQSAVNPGRSVDTQNTPDKVS